MKEPVRIGVVGAGAISQLAHLPVLAKVRDAQLVAVCDNDRPKARALADRFGIPDVFTDIEDLLELDELDAVVDRDAEPSSRAARAQRARIEEARALRAAALAHVARRRADSHGRDARRSHRHRRQQSPVSHRRADTLAFHPGRRARQDDGDARGRVHLPQARRGLASPPRGVRRGRRFSTTACRCSIWRSGLPTFPIRCA